MSAFMSKPFSKWAASEEISNDDLRGALTEIVGGLIDAELGGGVIKKEWVLRIEGKVLEPESSLHTRAASILFSWLVF